MLMITLLALQIYLLDNVGNYLTDDVGNRLVADVVPPPPPPPPPPLAVTIISPLNGQVVKGNGSVNISATAIYASTIKLLADNVELARCLNQMSCTTTWRGKNIPKGSHTINATATTTSESATATVTIKK